MSNINENVKSSASQKERILEYLMSGRSLTPIEALSVLYELQKDAADLS